MANTKITSAVIEAGAILNTHIASGAISSGHLSGINTGAVAEGSNLYYTDARAQTRARASISVTGGNLAYDSSTGVLQLTDNEIRDAISAGGNLSYNNSTGVMSYTTPTMYTDADAQGAITVTDAGGDGSLAYSGGTITYTGPSAAEVRAHLSAGNALSYSSGQFAVVAPTASGGTNTTALATTAFVQQEITTLIGGAPSTLNDLNELAAAINDDANYNTTLTTALATKLPLAGGTMTGNLTIDKEDPNINLSDTSSSRTLAMFVDNNNSVVRASGPLLLQVGSQSAITIDASRNTVLAGTLGSGAITTSSTLSSTINGNNASGGNIVLGALSGASKWFGITGRQYDNTTETEGYSLITGASSTGVNNVTIGGGLDEQNAATSVNIKVAANSTTRNGTEVVRVTTSGLDVRSNNIRITGTTVIDSSRNITSAAITSTGIITSAEFFKATGQNIKFSAGGTHVLNMDVNRKIYPSTHNSTDLGHSTTLGFRTLYLNGSIYHGTSQILDNSRNLANIGTIASSVIAVQGTDPGNPSAGTDQLRLSGYGVMGSRGSMYITNSSGSGDLQFGTGGVHGSSTRMIILADGKVGIGTTTPAAKLSITDENAGQAMLQVRNFNTTATGSFGNNHSVELRSASSTTTHGVLIQHYENNIGRRSLEVADSNGVFATFVQGKVGIGTSSPGALLDLETPGNTVDGSYYSTLTINNTGSSTYSGIRFDRSAVAKWRVGIMPDDKFQIAKLYNGVADDTFVINSSGNVGIGIQSPFSRLQSGGHTFSGGNGMYANGRVGMSNHGELTGLMLASTYNDAAHPEYGLVFVQGPSTSSYNVWSVSPDGPAKGDSLNFHYQAQSTNIHSPSNAKVVFDGNGNIAFGGNLHFKTAQNGSFIGSLNTSDLRLAADGNHIFQTYLGGWGTRMEIRDNGIRFPAGDYGVHTTQEHYTASTPASSYSTASNITYNSSTQYWPDQGEKQICVINARAFTKYIHIKTNLTANNIMFYFRTKGYFYNYGMEEQLIGGYTYYSGGNLVITKSNETVAGNTHTGDTYRASDGSLVLKMDINQTGYTEGKMLVFFHAHAPSTTSAITVTAVTQKDDGTNAF